MSEAPENNFDETVKDVAEGHPYAHLPRLGNTLKGYTLERILGRGGHAVVFLARTNEGERVAIKVLLVSGEQRLERLRREALVLGQLTEHAGIVGLREAFTENTPAFLVLDYVPGTTLATTFEDNRAGAEGKLDLLAQVGRAIHFAHQAKVVHRDLKPANILVNAGVAKITDFGHSLDLGRETRMTETGTTLGTPSYMAPEQVREGKHAGPSADVYALGVMLYEALTGSVVHARGSSPAEQQQDLLTRIPDPPSRINPKLGPDHDSVCLRALQKSPADRYPTALALARDIELLRQGLPLQAAGASSRHLVPWALVVGLVVAWTLVSSASATPSPTPAPQVTIPPTPASSPAQSGPDSPPGQAPLALVSLDAVSRLTGDSLQLGTRVTAEYKGRWRVAVVVGDSEELGYDLVFLNGETARARSPTGFLPDVIWAGAECHAKQGSRPELVGLVLERRGRAVLVEMRGERNWLPLHQVWLEEGQRVPDPPTPAQKVRLVNSLYQGSSYPAVELEREGDRSWVLYLDAGEIEWRSQKELAPLPATGAEIVFRPFGSNGRLAGTIAERRNGVLLVKVAAGEKHWVSWAQVRVRH